MNAESENLIYLQEKGASNMVCTMNGTKKKLIHNTGNQFKDLRNSEI